jgi:hypothetical protein
MKREKLISWTFWPEFAVFTTCHNATAEIRITTQKIIVLTVEFTKKLLRKAHRRVTQSFDAQMGIPVQPRRTSSRRLDAAAGILIDNNDPSLFYPSLVQKVPKSLNNLGHGTKLLRVVDDGREICYRKHQNAGFLGVLLAFRRGLEPF